MCVEQVREKPREKEKNGAQIEGRRTNEKRYGST
jgi:hypothetical protein